MKRRRLLWQIYPSYLLITLVSLVAVGWVASRSLEQFFNESVRHDLERQARAVVALLGHEFKPELSDELRAKCSAISQATGIRITIIAPSGEVICETGTSDSVENHGGRPEFRAALDGGTGINTRYSTTVDQDMTYVALPIWQDGRVAGAVRTAIPVTSITAQVRVVQASIATGGVIIAALAALVSLFVARRITRPIEDMRSGAERFAHGELSYKLPAPDSAELGGLADTLNEMAHQLEERLRTVVHQGNEQEAVLASMVEGVLAVDREQRIISLNRAASQVLACDRRTAVGRSLQEVVRNTDLRKFVDQALSATAPIDTDLVVRGDTDRVLQAHGTALRDAHGQSIGAVIVLNDVTSFRRLEDVRRDFVANVSHELKTPITSIKGFVETLLDGALSKPGDAERFLRIIAKQADRLNAIIEDLLSLSKIEQSEEAGDLKLEDGKVRDVLEAAVHDCQTKASERQINVDLECDESLTVKCNAPLMEQAVVNLLDNAIKYSDNGGYVEVSAQGVNGEIVISVRDQGCGIPADDLPRIFERFYRVDKARNRKERGGTGLGLSIVKHIVNVHHGRVTVESTLGRGSLFSILLPR
jgi:two-component system phosphate regulon sensor histidine kinase PhoR